MISRVKICFHKSNLPALLYLPGRACLTLPSWVMQKFLPSWATVGCSRDLWLTGRSIFCEVVRIRGQSPSFFSPPWQHPKSHALRNSFITHHPSLTIDIMFVAHVYYLSSLHVQTMQKSTGCASPVDCFSANWPIKFLGICCEHEG